MLGIPRRHSLLLRHSAADSAIGRGTSQTAAKNPTLLFTETAHSFNCVSSQSLLRWLTETARAFQSEDLATKVSVRRLALLLSHRSEGGHGLYTPFKGHDLTDVQRVVNSFISRNRAKQENVYGRLKTNFSVWQKNFRLPNDDAYDKMAWFTGQMTEVDIYYRPVRRRIDDDMEQFLNG
jgi:hypothetical protein